jgi:3' exoribonuclease, RNase T-like
VKVYYNTEFLEDGHTIELISIGMVAEDGRELYLVNEAIEQQPLYDRIRKHTWLMANVVPHLPLRRPHAGEKSHGTIFNDVGFFNLDNCDNRVVSRRYIRNAVRDFVLSTDAPELWAWYGAHNHVVLAQLFGRMINLPQGFPMWTNDVNQECQRLGNPAMPEQSGQQHNALADARYVKVMAEHLAALTR